MAKVKILVAEDDFDDFSQLKEAIEEVLPNFDMNHFRDGRDFMRYINNGGDADLIFLDLNMLYYNGIKCLVRIRETVQLKNVPVIIYSTSSHFEDIDACYKHGCTLYLVKPISYRVLVTQVQKVFFRLGLPRTALLDRERFVVQRQHQDFDAGQI